MCGTRFFRGVTDSFKELPACWDGDVVTGFPARIKAIRKDGVFLWYLPSDEIEHSQDRARRREERMCQLIWDMHHALKHEDKPYRLDGVGKKLEEFESRMEALGIEVH